MFTKFTFASFLFLMLAVVISQPVVSVVANPEEENQGTTVYIPIVMRGREGIHGTVTLNGEPAAAVPLELRFFDGEDWFTAAETDTDTGGNYVFLGIPGLEDGEEYYVLYRNYDGLEGRLWIWATRVLTMYEEGSAVLIEKFDIADIELVSPADGEIVSLPYTFHWHPRPASPGDSYEFNLLYPEDPSIFFYTEPSLGYVGSYTLESLPFGFQAGLEYVWEIWVYSLNGGFGVSFDDRWVIFTDGGS